MPTEYNPPVVEFLTKEDRAAWYNSETKFYVIAAAQVAGNFGPSARYTLQPVDEDGQPGEARYISFALTDQKTGAEIARRVDELTWFETVLNEPGSDSVGPLTLSQVPTSKGNAAWVFKAVK